jgi:hypothetical protein
LREYASVLSGTLPAGPGAELLATLGLGYAAAFMAATLLAPVLALGAGVLFVLSRLGGRNG